MTKVGSRKLLCDLHSNSKNKLSAPSSEAELWSVEVSEEKRESATMDAGKEGIKLENERRRRSE
jgi:hypothetical protein